MMGKKPARARTHGSRPTINIQYEDSEAQDIEEELRDVVFDYENSHAMLAIADDYLKEPDRKGASDTQSINSKTTTGSKMGSKIRENINS